MMPIGPLMIEHRLIEKVVALMEKAILLAEDTGETDPDLIQDFTHFILFYADRCHHGKEEDIFFKKLGKKNISKEHKTIVDELIEDHKWGRKTTNELIAANEKYRKGVGQGLSEITAKMKALIEFYPRHILKEDRRFFEPVMGYFTREERDAMLEEGYALDSKLLHEAYEETVSGMEKRLKS
jgi:hemerythrin-like domain-containing protein